MYILVLGRSYPSEKYPLQGIFELDQAKALSAEGHKVVMLVVDLRSIRRWRKFGFDTFERDGIKVYSYNFPLGAVPSACLAFFSDFFSRLLMKKIVKEEGLPDIIHAHFCYLQGYSGGMLSKQYKVPLVITEHSSGLMYNYNPKNDRYYEKGYAAAAGIICVGSALQAALKSHFGYESIVIPNIVALDDFVYLKKNNNECYTFVAVGNLIYMKGMDVLLQAFSQLNEQNVRLFIIGDGSERKHLEQQAEHLGVSEKVHFLGKQKRAAIASYLHQADCFVLASRSETFGVVYIEALATGTPVIATACGGPSDIVTEENGMLVTVDDAEALAAAMKKMMLSSAKYDHAKIAASASELYSAKAVAAQLGEYFSAVLG